MEAVEAVEAEQQQVLCSNQVQQVEPAVLTRSEREPLEAKPQETMEPMA